MRSVTRFITGQDDIPKQFCPMMGGLTWFENTRNRVAQLIPVNRSFIVVKQSHRDLYEPLVGDLPRSQIVAQPCDRGTAPAILCGLMRARSLGPHTTVAIFPSDHYVSDDAPFMRQVERAFDAVDAHPALAVLLGIRPDKAETSYGWIEPASRVSSWIPGLFRVKRFWEKPRWEFARTLLAGGCLWNSAVIVARASVLETMIADYAPEVSRAFNDCLARDRALEENVEAIFGKLETVGFSEHVLSNGPSNLAVQLVDDVQWSDLGEPERLIDTLRTLKSRPAWLEDLAREYRRSAIARIEA